MHAVPLTYLINKDLRFFTVNAKKENKFWLPMCEFLWTNCEHLKKKRKCQHLSGCTGIFQYSVLNFITCAIKQSSCEHGSYQHLNLIQSTLSWKTLVLCD